MKGKILVTIQFSCIVMLMVFTHWKSLPWWSYLVLLFSAVLAFWAMAVMRLGNFNIVPIPVETGTMVSGGPYRLIRHPMYTSIFIFAAALLAGEFNYYKLFISLVLVAGLVVKMYYEEDLLCKHYPEYKEFMKKTKRVIPFVW